jgi:hypothetical protein
MEAFGIAKRYEYCNTLVLKFGNELAAGYINENGEVADGINEFGNVVIDFAETNPRQQGTEVQGYAGGLISWIGIEHSARELKLYDKYGFDETIEMPSVLSGWLMNGTMKQKNDARKVFAQVGRHIAVLGKTLAKYYTIEQIVLTGGILLGQSGAVISTAANQYFGTVNMVKILSDNPITLKFGALVGLTYKAAMNR